MKIGISNISWSLEDNNKYAEMAVAIGYDYIESVYSKMPLDVPILAIQSIFYGSDIESFSDKRCIPYINTLIDDCKGRGVKIVTLGSPSMRVGNKANMTSFLDDLDHLLEGTGVKFCVEPNARYYGAEYYNTLESIVEDIYRYKNISSMIDVGNSIMEGQDCFKEYEKYGEHVSHIHFATPGLSEITHFRFYRQFYRELVSSGYGGNISYEFAKARDIETAIRDFYREVITYQQR
jgi:sugar phosphate isomerase/epimerase